MTQKMCGNHHAVNTKHKTESENGTSKVTKRNNNASAYQLDKI